MLMYIFSYIYTCTVKLHYLITYGVTLTCKDRYPCYVYFYVQHNLHLCCLLAVQSYCPRGKIHILYFETITLFYDPSTGQYHSNDIIKSPRGSL